MGFVLPVKVEKIDDIAKTKTIDQVSDCSTDHTGKCSGDPSATRREAEKKITNHAERERGDDDKEGASDGGISG